MIRPLAAAVSFALVVAPAVAQTGAALDKAAPGQRSSSQITQGSQRTGTMKEGDSEARALLSTGPGRTGGNERPKPPVLILTLVGLGLLALTVRHHARQRN